MTATAVASIAAAIGAGWAAPIESKLPDALVAIATEPGARFVAYLAVYCVARYGPLPLAVAAAVLVAAMDMHVAFVHGTPHEDAMPSLAPMPMV